MMHPLTVSSKVHEFKNVWNVLNDGSEFELPCEREKSMI